jgi:Ca2+-binding EF-hand superfamily protein
MLLSSALGRPVTDEELQKIREAVDVNGDETVTLPEMIKFISEWRVDEM